MFGLKVKRTLKNERCTHGNGCLFLYCPRCEEVHCIPVNEPGRWTDSNWDWNGSLETPSIGGGCVHAPSTKHRCHFYLRDGYFHYLNTSTHYIPIFSVVAAPYVRKWPKPKPRAKTELD